MSESRGEKLMGIFTLHEKCCARKIETKANDVTNRIDNRLKQFIKRNRSRAKKKTWCRFEG